MKFRSGGHIWGDHRVLSPLGSLPQAALQLDNSLPPFDNEILVHVSALQIDSASFHQLQDQGNIERSIQAIVSERGKMQNPVTQSGGVFLGQIEAIGPNHPLKNQYQVGDPVISLVSLTLTPLVIEKIEEVCVPMERIKIEGHAILFASSQFSKIPSDLPEGVVLAALDVCGAPAQVRRLVKKDDKVLILGLGKAGKAMALEANDLGAYVYGVDTSNEAVSWCSKNVKGSFEKLNAQNALEVFHWCEEVTKGDLMDIAIQATNQSDMEMSTILPCKEGGRALFFGMNTSFQKATLGAEGVGKDVSLLMGSGYVPGHAKVMLDLVRKHSILKEWLSQNYT